MKDPLRTKRDNFMTNCRTGRMKPHRQNNSDERSIKNKRESHWTLHSPTAELNDPFRSTGGNLTGQWALHRPTAELNDPFRTKGENKDQLTNCRTRIIKFQSINSGAVTHERSTRDTTICYDCPMANTNWLDPTPHPEDSIPFCTFVLGLYKEQIDPSSVAKYILLDCCASY